MKKVILCGMLLGLLTGMCFAQRGGARPVGNMGGDVRSPNVGMPAHATPAPDAKRVAPDARNAGKVGVGANAKTVGPDVGGKTNSTTVAPNAAPRADARTIGPDAAAANAQAVGPAADAAVDTQNVGPDAVAATKAKTVKPDARTATPNATTAPDAGPKPQ